MSKAVGVAVGIFADAKANQVELLMKEAIQCMNIVAHAFKQIFNARKITDLEFIVKFGHDIRKLHSVIVKLLKEDSLPELKGLDQISKAPELFVDAKDLVDPTKAELQQLITEQLSETEKKLGAAVALFVASKVSPDSPLHWQFVADIQALKLVITESYFMIAKIYGVIIESNSQTFKK